jgi:hypothetical protein
MQFMLGHLRDSFEKQTYLEYAPHVMKANKALDKIVR